jgi:uncharacterized membrane protein YidH (DUF202 family)
MLAASARPSSFRPVLRISAWGIAAMLVVLGIAVAMLSYRRWSTAEEAMRRGMPLPRVHLPLLLAVGILAVSIGALVLVVASR